MHFDADTGIGVTNNEDVVPAPHIGLSCLTTPIESDATPDGLPAKYDSLVLGFERPQPRVAPGQVVALYDGDALLGGGIAV